MARVEISNDHDQQEGALDHVGLRVLSLEACLDHLRGEPVGRVAFVQAGSVEVYPVNHVTDGTAVAFLTGPGSKLGAALHGLPVTFEVDGFDRRAWSGWSVVLKGTADLVTDEAVLERLDATGPHPMLRSARGGRWVLVRPDEITGRAIPGSPGEPPRR